MCISVHCPHRKAIPHKIRRRIAKLRYYYGLTLEQYNAMLAQQNGKCAICGGTPSAGQVNFDVDHNHITGKVRGLLCRRCNTLLGNCNDDVTQLERAIIYLRERGDR